MAAVFTTTIRSEIDVAPGAGAKPAKVQVTAEGYPHTKHHADDRGFPHFYPKTYVLRRGDVAQKVGEATPGRAPGPRRPAARTSRAGRSSLPPHAGPRASYRRAALGRLAHRSRVRGRASSRRA